MIGLYTYRARVRSVYDGDTMRVDIDLGCSSWIMNEPLRLYGVDTPELRGINRDQGYEARDFVRALLPEGKLIRIKTHKDKRGKFGRYLAEVYFQHDGHNLDLAEEIMAAGHGVEYFGGKRS